jgi:hypothetical protein
MNMKRRKRTGPAALLLAATLVSPFAVPTRLLATDERAIQQREQGPSSWIGQEVITKYAASLRSAGKVVDSGAIFRIYTATRAEGDRVWI